MVFNIVVSVVAMIIATVCMALGGQQMYEEISLSFGKFGINFFISASVSVFIIIGQRNKGDDYFNSILTRIDNQKEFKIILNNLEESLIVVSKRNINFVNDKFRD